MRALHRATVLASGLALAIPLLSTAPAVSTPAESSDPLWKTVAEGLDNPRQLSFSGDKLYVAEAGAGGSGPCFPGPEGAEVCYGESSAVTRIHHGRQKRVLSGLPSLAEAGGASAIGAGDVAVSRRNEYAVTIGLGANPALRAQLPARGQKLMGTVVGGKLHRSHHPVVMADLAAFEAAEDPDGAGPDSNPTGLLAHRHGWFSVTDSGGNDLVSFGRHHRPRAIAVFGSPGTATSPFPPNEEVAMQSVPTSVAKGPDGALYVSELTGFPFVPGAARIHRVVPGEPPTVYATGLTNVTDLAWHHGRLYAVQLSSAGLLNETGLPMGSVVKVRPGKPLETVVDSLPAPYGIAISGRHAYVSTCSVCADAGAVVKVPLR